MIVVLYKPKYAALSRQTQAQKPGIQLLRILATACPACPVCPCCCCPCVPCASQRFLGSINRSSYTHPKFEKRILPVQYCIWKGLAAQDFFLPCTQPPLELKGVNTKHKVKIDNGIYFVLGVCASIILVRRFIEGHIEFQMDCTNSVDPTQCSAKSL